jgi:hypothetical protein
MLVEFGAQIGNFALVWMSVELLGDAASYMQSLQYGAVLLGAALGGRLLDERDPRAVPSWSAESSACARCSPPGRWVRHWPAWRSPRSGWRWPRPRPNRRCRRACRRWRPIATGARRRPR